MQTSTGRCKKINTPCPHCGREEYRDFEPLGYWYSPCPADDCPSNSPNKDKMGYCPKCASEALSFDSCDAEAWSDDTPFPTITARFVCEDCGHAIEVSYDRQDEMHKWNNKVPVDWSYDPDPDGELDLDD